MPYEPAILGFKFSVRIRKLTGRDGVLVVCPACHKRYHLAPHVIYERFHDHLPLEQVSKEMRFKQCGNVCANLDSDIAYNFCHS